MGARGPRPQPSAVLKMRGSQLWNRERDAREAKGPAGAPDEPDWLDEEAKRAWNVLVPMLEAMRVLTRIDGNALARYCRLWSRWRQAEKWIEEKGEMYPIRNEDGSVKCFQQWPQVAIAHKLAEQLIRLEREFGLTPSARARLQISPVCDETDDLDKFFI